MLKAKDVFTKAPYSRVKELQRIMDLYGHRFGIESHNQLAMFYAQLLAEVGTKANIRSENMNYSARALKKVFKRFRDSPELAELYGRTKTKKANKEMIANIAYCFRLGNGSVKSSDGWNFRGRGYIQLTGRANYAAVNDHIKEKIGIDFMLGTFPEIVGTDTGAIISALGFWSLNSIHKVTTIDEATKKVNRYTDSYAKRRRYYNSLV